MDTRLMIGTWQVDSFMVKGEKTDTPDGWAKFTFFDSGVVAYAVTRQGKRIEDGIKRLWWVQNDLVNIYQDGKLAWHVKSLTPNELVLSQDDEAATYYCTRKTYQED